MRGIIGITVAAIALWAFVGCRAEDKSSQETVAREELLSVTRVQMNDSEDAGELSDQLAEAKRDFTYAGKPIPPKAVHDLLQWISDDSPGPVAIDLAGTFESNRYFGDVSADAETGWVTTSNEPEFESDSGRDLGYDSYRRVGVLSNGWQVLLTSNSGGGSGVFTDVLLIRFRVDREYGRFTRSRLLMERRGHFLLGDRFNGEVEVRGDSLFLGESDAETAPYSGGQVFVFSGVR